MKWDDPLLNQLPDESEPHVEFPARTLWHGSTGPRGCAAAKVRAGSTLARADGQHLQNRLYGRNFPFMVTTTRSPLGFSSFSTSSVKSMALIIPSPHFSWITSFSEDP